MQWCLLYETTVRWQWISKLYRLFVVRIINWLYILIVTEQTVKLVFKILYIKVCLKFICMQPYLASASRASSILPPSELPSVWSWFILRPSESILSALTPDKVLKNFKASSRSVNQIKNPLNLSARKFIFSCSADCLVQKLVYEKQTVDWDILHYFFGTKCSLVCTKVKTKCDKALVKH